MQTTLPWPPTKLSPNARVNWAQKARIAKKYRSDCYFAAHADGIRPLSAKGARLTLKFCPPDRRPRDMDNMIASLKSGLDGLADAMGMNDKDWVYAAHEVGEPVKHGAVEIHIEEKPSDGWKPIGELAAGLVKGVVA